MKNPLMNYSLVLIFCLLIAPFAARSQSNPLVIDVLITDNDTVFRHSYLYDAYGHKVLDSKYFQKNNDWERLDQTEWMYQGDTCTEQIFRKWKNNGWSVYYMIESTFQNGKKVADLHKVVNNSVATNFRKENKVYNQDTLLVQNDSLWINGAWQINEQTSFHYLPNSLLADTILVSAYVNGLLAKQLKSVFQYDAGGRIDNQQVSSKTPLINWTKIQLIKWYYVPGKNLVQWQWNKRWDTEETPRWENTQKIEYVYDVNDKLKTEIYYQWQSMFWSNVLRYDYEYTNNNLTKKSLAFSKYKKWRNAISVDYQNFTGSQPALIESKYTYWGDGDEGGLARSEIPYLLHDELTIENANKIEIVNLPYLETSVNNATVSGGIGVYPNPSNGIFYVDPQQHELISWEITDINGRIIQKYQNSFHSGMIDLKNMEPGIYLLRVLTTKGLFSSKLIKTK